MRFLAALRARIPARRAVLQIAVIAAVVGGGAYALLAPPASRPDITADDVADALNGPLARGRPAAKVAAEPILKTLKIRSGETLLALLDRAGVALDDARDIVAALDEIYDPRMLRAGQEIALTFDPDDGVPAPPRLSNLLIKANYDRVVTVNRAGDNFSGREIVKNLDMRPTRVGGRIDSSLFAAAERVGVPRPILLDMIKVFSFDVDFQRDVREGDEFELLFERYFDENGHFVAEGNLLYAALTVNGTTLRVYRHPTPDGEADYFNERGESVKKAMMRTPIDGARLSSVFGMRNHPMLGFSRMHRGIDFAAPQGTPIMAAGDGVVDLAERNGAYGNYMRIRHNSEFASAYAHMSRFAHGVRRGVRVRQGQIIGYVGATGLATGPHLHYEVLRGGQQMNPLNIKMPAHSKLAGADFAKFKHAVSAMHAQIAALPRTAKLASRE